MIIARVGFPDKSPPSGWSVDHEGSITYTFNIREVSPHLYGVEGWVNPKSCFDLPIVTEENEGVEVTQPST